jgi:hypothetical protein
MREMRDVIILDLCINISSPSETMRMKSSSGETPRFLRQEKSVNEKISASEISERQQTAKEQ